MFLHHIRGKGFGPRCGRRLVIKADIGYFCVWWATYRFCLTEYFSDFLYYTGASYKNTSTYIFWFYKTIFTLCAGSLNCHFVLQTCSLLYTQYKLCIKFPLYIFLQHLLLYFYYELYQQRNDILVNEHSEDICTRNWSHTFILSYAKKVV